jgi:hypothetical protein
MGVAFRFKSKKDIPDSGVFPPMEDGQGGQDYPSDGTV